MNKWLDKYDDGGKKKFLEPNDKKLPSGRIHPFYYQPSSELAQSIGGEEGEPAYLIPTFKYGHPLDNPLEEYRRTGEHLGGPFKTWQEADEWDKTIRHPYVEKNEALPSPLKRWGKDYENGGFLGTTNKGRNYSPAWGGQFQNGGEMRYYQNGLDFKPKTISRNGSVVKDNLGYWNPMNQGKVVEIDSPNITMRNVNQSLIGISDEGDTKLLQPNNDYHFKGKKVREYPIAQKGGKYPSTKYGINEVHQLQDFTNKPSTKNWLNKYNV